MCKWASNTICYVYSYSMLCRSNRHYVDSSGETRHNMSSWFLMIVLVHWSHILAHTWQVSMRWISSFLCFPALCQLPKPQQDRWTSTWCGIFQKMLPVCESSGQGKSKGLSAKLFDDAFQVRAFLQLDISGTARKDWERHDVSLFKRFLRFLESVVPLVWLPAVAVYHKKDMLSTARFHTNQISAVRRADPIVHICLAHCEDSVWNALQLEFCNCHFYTRIRSFDSLSPSFTAVCALLNPRNSLLVLHNRSWSILCEVSRLQTADSELQKVCGLDGRRNLARPKR